MHARKVVSKAPRIHFKACKNLKIFWGHTPRPPSHNLYSMGPTFCICPGPPQSSQQPCVHVYIRQEERQNSKVGGFERGGGSWCLSGGHVVGAQAACLVTRYKFFTFLLSPSCHSMLKCVNSNCYILLYNQWPDYLGA